MYIKMRCSKIRYKIFAYIYYIQSFIAIWNNKLPQLNFDQQLLILQATADVLDQ